MKDDSPSFPKLNYRLKRASSPDQDHPINIKDITMAELDIDDIQRRMDASLASLHNEFMGLRAGRASTGMLEPIMVDAYGSKMPMNQVGNISAPEPRLLTVSVWDAGMASSVEKAIRESDLGLNPSTEGNLIRVPIPDLSEERRKDMVKVAGRYAEACRVARGSGAAYSPWPARCNWPPSARSD